MAKKIAAKRPPKRRRITSPLKIVYVPLAKLKDDPANARAHDERNLNEIRKSVESLGAYAPIIAQAKTKLILAGHGRKIVFKEKGIDPAPVVFLNVDDATAKEIALRDNRTAELAAWDPEKLNDLLQSLEKNLDLTPDDVGFSEDELSAILADLDDEEEGEGEGGESEDPPATEFKILVLLKNEKEQLKLLEYLTAQGYECRSLNT